MTVPPTWFAGPATSSAVAVAWEIVLEVRQPVGPRQFGGCTLPMPDACPEPPPDSYVADVRSAQRAAR
ncbi:hypothetical protein SAMN06272737_12280 [Blastococcus mobilis]|uniref:Uncharacterized protein n=1 Tax=Blastococcus mobilis TaxID=1938746 RepID=A0A238YWF0_9ACTN|nr:hypothetical protein SAMN06272737_12280 [Blastococcus mobilis]